MGRQPRTRKRNTHGKKNVSRGGGRASKAAQRGAGANGTSGRPSEDAKLEADTSDMAGALYDALHHSYFHTSRLHSSAVACCIEMFLPAMWQVAMYS